jgi:hypothetical protein
MVETPRLQGEAKLCEMVDMILRRLNLQSYLYGDHEHFWFCGTRWNVEFSRFRRPVSTSSRPFFGTPRLQGEGGFSS